MPIYEYQCDDCGAEFQELVMSRAAGAEVVCGQCKSQSVVKLLSGAAVKSGGSSAASEPVSPSPRGGCGGGCSCH